MKILGIDTTTKFLSLGAFDGLKIYEYNLESGPRHSSLLIPTIERILDALGWQADDIDYFACGLGPGSFTGVRIGLASIKGLAWAVQKPVIGISTLDILAAGAGGKRDAWVIPIIDAKRSLVYCSIYKGLKRIAPYMLLSEEELFKKIKSNAIILGDAVDLYRQRILSAVKGSVILDRDYWYPKGHAIIKLALEKVKKRELKSPFQVKPIYLYPKECQIRR